MSNRNCTMFSIALLAFMALISSAQASTVNTSVPTASITTLGGFAGANIESFDGVTPGTYSSPITLGNTTYSVNTGASFHIDGDYANQYNTTNDSLHNCYCSDSFGQVKFSFSQPVGAIGFHWGASDSVWTLSAYSASNVLLESFALPVTSSSNSGNFVGLVDAGIKYAFLTGASSDYVLVDDFATTVTGGPSTVPLPAGVPLFGSALLILGVTSWYRRRHQHIRGGNLV